MEDWWQIPVGPSLVSRSHKSNAKVCCFENLGAFGGEDSTIYSLDLGVFEWSRLQTTGLDPMLLGELSCAFMYYSKGRAGLRSPKSHHHPTHKKKIYLIQKISFHKKYFLNSIFLLQFFSSPSSLRKKKIYHSKKNPKYFSKKNQNFHSKKNQNLFPNNCQKNISKKIFKKIISLKIEF